jgi:hypothetical protein
MAFDGPTLVDTVVAPHASVIRRANGEVHTPVAG